MAWILKEKWLWIIVAALTMIVTIPLLVIWLILNLPPYLRLVVTLCIIVLGAVAAGYKDWIVSKRKEEEIRA